MRFASLVLAASFAATPLLALAQTTTTSTGTKMAPNGSNAAAAAKANPGSAMSAPGTSGTSTSGMGASGMSNGSTGTASSSGGMSKTGGDVGQYSTESAATSACSGDTVVWANATSKALHMSGDRYFGKSKHGFFTCEKQALASGYHVAGHRGSHKHSKTA